jgi:iron complex outermembrane receptor protein
MAQSTSAPSQNGLADASLEELMNIQVTSVSKKAQPLSSAAASVFVISAEDIRRSGITVIPELLRLAPGVQVARLSSGSWAIGIRGFNDEYSNKLLVLIDGRSVYNVFYTGVYWDTLNLAVDDIERIEVNRGPGAAMWGTNAVNGVINIITKSAKSTHGGLVVGGAGSEVTSGEMVRYGGEIGGADYRVGVQNSQFDPLQVVGSIDPSRGWINRNGSLRADWDISTHDSLMVSGDIYQSNLGLVVPDGTVASPNAPPGNDKTDTVGGNVVARWEHIVSDTSSIEVRFSYDHSTRNDPQANISFTTFDYGVQQHLRAGRRHDFIYGLSYRETSDHTTPTPVLSTNPLHDSRAEVALFAEDEIALIPDKLHFIVGAQESHTENLGFAIQPTGRLLWSPTGNLSSWVAVSRAVRLPSVVETGLSLYEAAITVPSGATLIPSFTAVPHVIGNPAERSETVLAYEAGQRVQASKRISFDLSTFYNVYQHLSSYSTGAPLFQYASGIPYLEIPITAGNQRHGESYGTELAITWNTTSRWRLTGGYDWLRVETRSYPGDVSTDQLRTSSATPHHQWQLRSNFDLTRKIQIDTALYYTAAMLQTGIPQHLRGDLHISWRPLPKIEFSIGVQDAFEANHVEYESTRFNQISEVPRNVYSKVTWRF